MPGKRLDFVSFLVPLTLVAALVSGACRPEKDAAPDNLIVINSPASGRVSRIFVAEGTDVAEKATLIEIAAAPVVVAPAGDQQMESTGGENIQSEMRAAEERLQRVSVELQRIEPLVAAGSAPQSHLDAARAEYQQAQEHLDQLSRRASEAPPQSSAPASKNPARTNAPKITIVTAPAAGNVRVISVRVGQSVKAGEPLATILARR